MDGALEGDGSLPIAGLSTLQDAGADEATFIASDAHARHWAACKARVAVVDRRVKADLSVAPPRTLIRVENADLAVARILEAFAPAPALPAVGAHPTAVIEPGAQVGEGSRIGAHASVAAGARLGRGCVLHAGARIGAATTLGDECVVHANAVIEHRCTLGHRVVIGAGAVIGGDGFGFRPAADGRRMVHIPHNGTVVLEDEVEIGAGTCVDRAKFGATRVGRGTKIDNLCQIAHGCRIGRMTVIAGLCGLAGSVTVGDGVQMGGNCGIGDHRTIGDGARLAAKSAVMEDVPPGAAWGGMPAQDIRAELRVVAAIRKLPEWSRKLRRLLEEPTKGA